MASSSGHQPNFAALNRGRHLCSAGRPSRWALAHILVWLCHTKDRSIVCHHLLIFMKPASTTHCLFSVAWTQRLWLSTAKVITPSSPIFRDGWRPSFVIGSVNRTSCIMTTVFTVSVSTCWVPGIQFHSLHVGKFCPNPITKLTLIVTPTLTLLTLIVTVKRWNSPVFDEQAHKPSRRRHIYECFASGTTLVISLR